MQQATSTTLMDSHGAVLKVNGAASNPMSATSGAGGGFSSFTFYPDQPVGVGSTWSKTYDLSKIPGAASGMAAAMRGKIPATFRVTRFLNGGKSVEIASSMSGTMNMAQGSMKIVNKMKASGTMVVDTATGMLVSMNQTMTNAASMNGQIFSNTTKTVMNRK